MSIRNKILFSLGTALLFAGCAASAFDLVLDGKPASGVKAEGTEPGLQLAVKEIINYTAQVTGADISNTAPKMIITTLNNKNLPVRIKGELSSVKSDEGFFMGTVDGKFYIVGTTGTGAWYGACDFMEKYLGVRFYTPYKDGTLLKQKKTVSVPDAGRVDYPVFPYRLVNQCSSHGFDQVAREWAGHNRLHAPGPWGIRDTMVKYRAFHEQRMRLDRTSEGGHLTFAIPVPAAKYGKTHPEYFALVDGKRQVDAKMLHHCITNPGVQELVYQHICKVFDTYGVENIAFLFGAPDSLRGWCQCENCRKLDGGTDINVTRRFHSVAQKIAKRVWAKYPKAKILAWAYWNYREVPENVEIDPRTIIYFCSHGRCYAHALDDPACGRNAAVLALLKKWQKINKNIFIYEYGIAVPYCYEPYSEVMIKDLKLYRKMGLLGRKEEIHYPATNYNASPELKKNPYRSTWAMLSKWQFWYLLAKACWNPDIDFNKVIAEIESDYYGKTYPAMKKYNDLRRKLWRETPGCIGFPHGDERTPQLLQRPGAKEQLFRYLDDAAKLAKGDIRLEKQIRLERELLQEFWVKTNDKYRESLGRKLAAPAAGKPVVIDGKANDPAWGKAFYINTFLAAFDGKKTPMPAALATTTGILSDNSNLYFLIQAKDPQPGKLKAQALPGSDVSKKIWQDDIIELFLVPQNNSQKYYQIVVNPKGTVLQLEQPGSNAKINLGVTAKGIIGKDGYTVELKVPTGKMDGVFAPGMNWKAHIARSRTIRDGNPAGPWSLDGSAFHSRVDYRTMMIGNPIIRNGSFEEGVDKNGFPKFWSLRNSKKDLKLSKLENGSIRLFPGTDLRQIPYGGIFMPEKDTTVEISFRASGKGQLHVSNARFTKLKEKGNKFIKTESVKIVKLTDKPVLYTAVFTVKAKEFTQIIFTPVGKPGDSAVLDDVSLIRK